MNAVNDTIVEVISWDQSKEVQAFLQGTSTCVLQPSPVDPSSASKQIPWLSSISNSSLAAAATMPITAKTRNTPRFKPDFR